MITQSEPTFYFIGVSTSQSSINQVFPLWMEVMGHPEVKVQGIDHPIHDAPEHYRNSVLQIKHDPDSLGALVTTHKLDLFKAAKDLFDDLDPFAQMTEEVSCISKRGQQLRGHAKDPITAGLSLDSILKKNYFAETSGQVLCLGAGGAALATLVHLLSKQDAADRPEKFIVVDKFSERLKHMKSMVAELGAAFEIEYVLNSDARQNDVLMGRLPEGSVVINATGMGKDIPGSPISNDAVFPRSGTVWEFNYRGELDFLHQAKRQEEARQLQVEDGWVYFLHGWSQVIAEVLDIEITPELFKKLDEAAIRVRS